ncbi:MAG: sigma factor [bacterium]
MDEPRAPRPDPDRDLLDDLREGRPGAAERFFRRFWPVALAYARTVLADDAEAEDAAIEGIERALRGLPAFRGDCRISTWVIDVCRNRARERARARSRRPGPLSLDDCGEPHDPGPEAARDARPRSSSSGPGSGREAGLSSSVLRAARHAERGRL